MSDKSVPFTVYFDGAEATKLTERARANGRKVSTEARMIVRSVLGLGDFGNVASA